MKILITGGTGFVGSALSPRLLDQGHQLTVIGSRKECRLPPHANLSYVAADTTQPGPWQQLVGEQDVLVNLTGQTVFNLWTTTYKQAIYNSRILTTRHLVEALPAASQAVLLNASAAGYYGNGGEKEKNERSQNGTDFLAKVCFDWEQEAGKATEKGVRVVLMRFGVILGKEGGAIATMKRPFQCALGGPIGTGAQWFPWIHIEDLVSALIFLMHNTECQGPFNFSAPEPIRQKEFAQTLGRVLHRPAILPVPGIVMKLVLGEFGRSLLQGQKVIPEALGESGYLFTYPELTGALKEVLGE